MAGANQQDFLEQVAGSINLALVDKRLGTLEQVAGLWEDLGLLLDWRESLGGFLVTAAHAGTQRLQPRRRLAAAARVWQELADLLVIFTGRAGIAEVRVELGRDHVLARFSQAGAA